MADLEHIDIFPIYLAAPRNGKHNRNVLERTVRHAGKHNLAAAQPEQTLKFPHPNAAGGFHCIQS